MRLVSRLAVDLLSFEIACHPWALYRGCHPALDAALAGRPDLLRRVYAHESHLPVSSGARKLGSRGLLAGF